MVGEPGRAQLLGDARAVLATDLDHRAELFGEQAGEHAIVEAALEGVGLLLETIDIHHVGVVAHGVEDQRQAAFCSEGHLAHGGEEAAVGAVVVGQQHYNVGH